MSHYFRVETLKDGELDAYLNVSASHGISKFYEQLGASQYNRGVCGDGEKEIKRETLVKILKESDGPSVITEFLDDVLAESDSESFIFHFS